MGRSGGAARFTLLVIVVGHSGIPALEGRTERAVERPGSGLQEQVRAGPAPLHLLLLGEALGDYGVDGQLHEGRGDSPARPVALAVVDQARAVEAM